MLNFPINIIENFFKNTEISQIIDSPIVLNILYKKKYKSDIRNIFWRKVDHLPQRNMNPDNEWHKYSTYRSTHSPPRSHCLHYEIDSVWEVTHSVCFWTSLSWFCLSFVRKELGHYCCWDEILYMNWRTRREWSFSPGTRTRKQFVQKWLWHLNL